AYNPGPINGVFTAATRRALIDFQPDSNLAKTGRLDAATIDVLGFRLSTNSNEEGRYRADGRDRKIDPNGQSTSIGVTSTHRFIIWRNGNQWHIRTTTAGQMHIFTGRIVASVDRYSGRHSCRLS